MNDKPNLLITEDSALKNNSAAELDKDFSINIIQTESPNKTIFENVKNKIISQIIAPSYYNDIQDTVESRKKWRNMSNKIETLSKILVGSSTIVAFASGVYQYQYLSFIAGCLGTAGIVCQQFATYAIKESQERTEQANKVLKNLNIHQIEDLTIEQHD